MHHSESSDDVCPCPVTDSDAVLDPQLVQDCHQVLSQGLNGWKRHLFEVFTVVFLTRDVDMDKNGALLHFFELVTVHKSL